MVADLDPRKITFDRRTGRYRSPFGGFLSSSDIDQIIQKEYSTLTRKLERITNQLIDRKIAIADFEKRALQETKSSISRMAMMGAGGKQAFGQDYKKMAQSLVSDRAASLYKLSEQIRDGVLSEAQIRDRARRQATSVFQSYNQADFLQRIEGRGHNEAMRSLAGGAAHCSDCPGYATQGEYFPIESVVPVGTACICGGYCRCQVKTRLNRERALQEMMAGGLIDRVAGAQARQESVADKFRDRYNLRRFPE